MNNRRGNLTKGRLESSKKRPSEEGHLIIKIFFFDQASYDLFFQGKNF